MPSKIPTKSRPAGAKPARPSPKTSQGGYGHKSSTGGSTTPQGSGKNPANGKRGG